MTPGLILDGSGFVRRSERSDGNVSEGKTLAGMLQRLGAPTGALIVMDRGIASEENLAWLREQGYRYLVAGRERDRQFDPAAAIAIDTASGEPIQLQRVRDDDGQEVRLYCYSEQRAEKEKAMERRFAERFEAGLQQLAEGLTKPLGEKRIAKLSGRIGRLKAKCRSAGRHHTIERVPDPTGQKATALRFEKQPVDGSRLTHPGVCCLRTNEITRDTERLWRTHTRLTDLEAVFRGFKPVLSEVEGSELGLRPVFHHKPDRVDGHLFITVPAYPFVQITRRPLKNHDLHDRWSTVRDTLAGPCRVTATCRRADGRILHVRKATRARAAGDLSSAEPQPCPRRDHQNDRLTRLTTPMASMSCHSPFFDRQVTDL